MQRILASVGLAAVAVAAQVAVAPSAQALCTPQQWEATPDQCQQIFQRDGPGTVVNPNDVWLYNYPTWRDCYNARASMSIGPQSTLYYCVQHSGGSWDLYYRMTLGAWN